MKRRDFMKWTAAASAGPFVIPGIKKQTEDQQNNHPLRILFQGDSITDAGRDKKNQNANTTGGLGSGYAFLASSRLFELRSEERRVGKECRARGGRRTGGRQRSERGVLVL